MANERASDKIHKSTLNVIIAELIGGKSDKQVVDHINKIVGIQTDLLYKICQEQRANIAELMPPKLEEPKVDPTKVDPTKVDPTKVDAEVLSAPAK